MFLVHADYQSGIINEDIYRSPFLRKRVESRFRSPAVANVERQQTDIRMVFRFQFALYGSQFLYIPSVENQAVAIHGKFTRTALSYTRRSTCDEYDFLFHSYKEFNVTGAQSYDLLRVSANYFKLIIRYP